MGHKDRVALFLPDMGSGGAERVALALMQGLLDRGYEVDLVLAGSHGSLLPTVPPAVTIVDLNVRKLRQAVLPLARYLRRRRPLAMHVMMWPMPLLALAARTIARVHTRMVGSEHVVLSRMPFALNHRLVCRLTGLLYARLDGVVAVSAGVADDMAAMLELPRDRITVIHNPLLLPSVLPPAGTMIDRWPSGTRRLLAAGELKEVKNYPLLLRALQRLRRRIDVSLLILGEGALLDQTRVEAERLGLGDAVVLAGFENDIWPYFASAEAFVLSSDYEGFGNVLIEALHAGLPVVSTDCPFGPREILRDGRFGQLVPCDDEEALADALERAFADRHDAEAGRARAAELSGADAIARHLAIMLPSQR